jgi:hypothetical protein
VISNQDVKSDLKNVLREHLDKRVSKLFLDQSFAIIDQAAISKESFAVAADRISKRIALFVDNSLSQTVYSNLMALIGTTSSPQGIRRRYARADFPHKVLVKYNGKQYELNAENISEGGMLIKAAEQFPIDAKVEIMLSLEPGHSATVKGIVVTNKNPVRSISKGVTGMGIEFNKDIEKATVKLLRKYVEDNYNE